MGTGCGKIEDQDVNVSKGDFTLKKKDMVKIKTTNPRDDYEIGDKLGDDKFTSIHRCKHKTTRKHYLAKLYQIKSIMNLKIE